MTTPPNEPAGPLQEIDQFDESIKESLIVEIENGPELMHSAVAGLSEDQLDQLYKNWTIRQIAHHVADSHVHSYIRFKWAMNEDQPTIKAYDESVWATNEECRTGSVEPALALLTGIHMKWGQLLRTMQPDDFERTFFHPESKSHVRLWTALNYYPWHMRHHTGQIRWLRENRLGESSEPGSP